MTYLTQNNHITRGDGAGGSKTNENGLHFEKTTDLSSEYSKTRKVDCKDFDAKMVKFGNHKKQFISANQTNFRKVMNKLIRLKNTQKLLHGAKKPDEAYIDKNDKTIIIIEKKMQKSPGSVCEKIQTGPAKKWSYQKTYPGWNIIYIYTLSNWFKKNCIGELKYLKECNIPVFWGESPTYKYEIVDFINQL